ncbi:PRC-barrel domain-containing protein [Phaeovulum sp. W22_SRMD_FR3]|uniref:PRC-barrel domain-containing protein n=1 Tax=Phaeovulum sp. W22_SRMD_FR3 TaxID=3240274 RepID=UPI003F9A20F5
MKKLMISTAILGATAFMAQAQAAPELFRTTTDATEIHASDFIGKRVYASDAEMASAEVDGQQDGWNDVGEINDVLLSRNGTVDAVLVDIGGFLGMGEHQVAVNMGSIKFVADASTPDDANDYFLVMTANEEALKAAPAYDDKMADAAATDAPMTDAATTDMAQTDAPMATDPAAEAPVPGDMANDNAATTMPDASATTTADATASTDMTAPAADATGSTMAMTPPEGYVAAAPEEMTAENLTGTAVYGSDNAKIGEVGKLLLDGNGQITEAVIDVGGFLGLGEKPVALPIGDINIVKAAEGDELRVYVGDTKDQLKAMPEYEG